MTNLQYSAIQYSAIQYSAIQYSALHKGAAYIRVPTPPFHKKVHLIVLFNRLGVPGAVLKTPFTFIN